MTSKSLVASALLILVSAGSGCTMFTKDKGSKKDSPWESMKFWKKEYQTPAKMAVLWSPDLLTVPGQPPTRGFGGRIYFYNERSQTIPVDGELVVHGFDEARKKLPDADQNQPDKRFRFTAEQFTEHFSESEIGASYSVWIPWDSNDYTQKELTLIPTFVSKNGQMLQGAPAKVIIPGRTATAPGPVLPIQTVAYEQSSIPTVEGKLPVLGLPSRTAESQPASTDHEMKVTTIKIPSQSNNTLRRPPVSQATGSGTSAQPNQAIMQNMQNLGVPNTGMAQPHMNPQVNAQLEQLRAQMVADAFRPMNQPAAAQPAPVRQPASTNGSWSPHTAPSASQYAANLNNVTPPNYMQPNANVAPPSGAPTTARPAAPYNPSSHAPYRGDDYPGGLPPGIQLSPPATAW